MEAKQSETEAKFFFRSEKEEVCFDCFASKQTQQVLDAKRKRNKVKRTKRNIKNEETRQKELARKKEGRIEGRIKEGIERRTQGGIKGQIESRTERRIEERIEKRRI